jgi:hypothetical protein
MNYITKSIFAISSVLLLSTSCNKSDYDGNNNTILANNTATLLKEFHTTPASFSLVAGTTKELVGPDGTFLRFYPNSFRRSDGSTINGETVNVQLSEMYSAGDMLKNYSSTNTGTGVLTSGGQVFIKATVGGEEVYANKYGIGFNALRTPASGPRALYTGNTYAAGNIVTWAPGSGATGTTTTGAGPVSAATTSSVSGSYFMFDSCTSFNWVGCYDLYSGTFQNITIKVKLANEMFAGNVWSVVGITLPSERVATVLYQESFDRSTQTGVYKGWAPTGTVQRLMFLIPRDKSTWYYYKTEQLLTDGMTVNATLIKASKDEMDAALTLF